MPIITPINPNQGSTSGNTTVTITGTNLNEPIAVKFGKRYAAITDYSATTITVQSPAGTGVQDVVVITKGGTSNPLSFYYIQPPFVTGLSADSGSSSGGNSLSVFGYNLATTTSVKVGSLFVTPTLITDNQVTFSVPEGNAGVVNISLITIGGSSLVLQYNYMDSSSISSLTPTSGYVNGGIIVTITGTNLTSTTGVMFGGILVGFGIINSTTIVAIAPAHSIGTVDVAVTTDTSSATLSDGFTYVTGPGI